MLPKSVTVILAAASASPSSFTPASMLNGALSNRKYDVLGEMMAASSRLCAAVRVPLPRRMVALRWRMSVLQIVRLVIYTSAFGGCAGA